MCKVESLLFKMEDSAEAGRDFIGNTLIDEEFHSSK